MVPTPDFLRAAVEQRQGSVPAQVLLWRWSSQAAKWGTFPEDSSKHWLSKTQKKTFTWNVKIENSAVKPWCSGFWGLKCLPSSPAQIHPSRPSSRMWSHPAQPLLCPHCWSPRDTQISWTSCPITAFHNTTGSVSYRYQFFFFFLSFFFFYWSIVDLQSFRCIAKWFIHINMCLCMYIYIHMYICIPFQILFHCRLLQDIDYRSLCYTVGLCCLAILYIVLCIC